MFPSVLDISPPRGYGNDFSTKALTCFSTSRGQRQDHRHNKISSPRPAPQPAPQPAPRPRPPHQPAPAMASHRQYQRLPWPAPATSVNSTVNARAIATASVTVIATASATAIATVSARNVQRHDQCPPRPAPSAASARHGQRLARPTTDRAPAASARPANGKGEMYVFNF